MPSCTKSGCKITSYLPTNQFFRRFFPFILHYLWPREAKTYHAAIPSHRIRHSLSVRSLRLPQDTTLNIPHSAGQNSLLGWDGSSL